MALRGETLSTLEFASALWDRLRDGQTPAKPTVVAKGQGGGGGKDEFAQSMPRGAF